MPLVSVVILNYNTFSLTCDCIRSVQQHTKGTDYEIILVDNASTECDPARFAETFPSIRLVASPVNGGFAAGNNLGIARAGGEYILLINSDTILQEDSISKTVSCYQQNPEAGVIGCRMVYPDGKLQYTARRFRSISWELLDLFRFIPYCMPYAKRSRRMLGKYFRHDESVFCDWLNGAFFMFPKKILEQLPGQKLDERFFMYGEDQLWCEQVRELGYRNYFYPGTTIIHINSGSTSPEKQLALRKTMLKHELEIMKRRKGKGLYYCCFRLIYGAKEGGRNLIKSLVYKLTGRVMR